MEIFFSNAHDNPYEENVWNRTSKSLLFNFTESCILSYSPGTEKPALYVSVSKSKTGESQTLILLERPRVSKCPWLLLCPSVQDPGSLHPTF